MQKRVKIALCSLAVIAVALGGAAIGFYEGLGVGAKLIGGIAENNKAHDALFEVKSSMVALGKSDLNLSQRQLALHLREALFELGALSKTGRRVQCTGKDKRALADAAGYVATHPDPVLFNADSFLISGMKFCESVLGGPGATVTSMTADNK